MIIWLNGGVQSLFLCSDDLDAEAAKLAADIEADYPAERVHKLVESGGFDRD